MSGGLVPFSFQGLHTWNQCEVLMTGRAVCNKIWKKALEFNDFLRIGPNLFVLRNCPWFYSSINQFPQLGLASQMNLGCLNTQEFPPTHQRAGATPDQITVGHSTIIWASSNQIRNLFDWITCSPQTFTLSNPLHSCNPKVEPINSHQTNPNYSKTFAVYHMYLVTSWRSGRCSVVLVN